jgi:hypothetical protein
MHACKQSSLRAISAGTRSGKEYGGAILVSRADKRSLEILADPFSECHNPRASRRAVVGAVHFTSRPHARLSIRGSAPSSMV